MTKPSLLHFTNLNQMLIGGWISQAVYVVAKLKISDLLRHGMKSIDEIAKETSTHAPTLYRLLRTLCSVGIYEETQDKFFGLTPMAECLCSDHPNSLYSVSIMYGEAWHFLPWNNILSSVKSGKSAFECTFGVDLFEYMKQNHEANQVFNDAMLSLGSLVNDAVVEGYNYSGINTLVDVGGGKGVLVLPLLQANPNMKGIVLDVPHVIDEFVPVLEKSDLRDRCHVVKGDFFESIPTGGDAYVLKHIIHDWDDDRSGLILANCRRAMPKQSKLLIIERILPLGNAPSPAKINDLKMLVFPPSGRERTEVEFRELLQSSGFELAKIYPTDSPLYILEATCY